MALLNKKLRGTTLIETLIALTIFISCISIATLVIVHVTGTIKRVDHIKAILALEQIAKKIRSNQQIGSDSIAYASYTIYQHIAPSAYSKRILFIELKAVDRKNHVIATQYEICKRP